MTLLGIVVSSFNATLTVDMLRTAEDKANELGYQTLVVRVPGAYDAPLAVKKLLEQENVAAVAVLGAILKGDTRHDEVIATALAKACTDLSLSYDKPVTLGVIGPGVTYKQAEARKRDYAVRAVSAADKLIRTFQPGGNCVPPR